MLTASLNTPIRAYWSARSAAHTEFIISHCLLFIWINERMLLWLFQKLNDNSEQMIKRRKKKEGNTLEEKSTKKNKVPKQGWEPWLCNITPLSVCVGACVVFIIKLSEKLMSSWASQNSWIGGHCFACSSQKIFLIRWFILKKCLFLYIWTGCFSWPF